MDALCCWLTMWILGSGRIVTRVLVVQNTASMLYRYLPRQTGILGSQETL